MNEHEIRNDLSRVADLLQVTANEYLSGKISTTEFQARRIQLLSENTRLRHMLKEAKQLAPMVSLEPDEHGRVSRRLRRLPDATFNTVLASVEAVFAEHGQPAGTQVAVKIARQVHKDLGLLADAENREISNLRDADVIANVPADPPEYIKKAFQSHGPAINIVPGKMTYDPDNKTYMMTAMSEWIKEPPQ